MLSEILFRIQELERRMANMISFGKIYELDLESATCKVQVGEIKTASIPWLTQRALASQSFWWSPKIDEQVMVLSPSGDYTQAIAVPAIYQKEARPKSTDDKSLIITMGQSQFEMKTDGSINITAPKGTNINTASVIVTGDVIAGGISLKNHVHGGVRSGPSTTSPPQGG